MLSAQTSQSKEILAAITSEGKVIMFPTQSNDAHNVNFSFPYSTPDGLIMMNYVVGNPDPANPLNDGKYQDDDIGIEIADRVKGVILYYKVVGFVHSHPIENGYDYDNPSPNDKTNASQYPSKIKHYILNDNKLIEFNSSGIVSTINRPCK